MAKRLWTRRMAGGLSTLAALALAASILGACDLSDLLSPTSTYLEGKTQVGLGGVGKNGTFACGDSLPDAALVIVSSPVGGAEVSSGFEVSGWTRTFESNVQWRLSDRPDAVLASGYTSGGGIDGAAPFTFTVEYKSAERQIAHLEVFEDDVSEGEGYPPPRTVIPLVIPASG